MIRKIQKRLTGNKQALKNCYQVEIRQFDRYIQNKQVTNPLDRNVQLISQKLIEHYPYAAEKILSDFFKLKMSHLPLSWNLYKEYLIDYLKMDIPENRMRKIKLKDLIRFRQTFINNIKFPLNWKQPRKGRNLSDLDQLENLFLDITEDPNNQTNQTTQSENLEQKVKSEEILVSSAQTAPHPTQNIIHSAQPIQPRSIEDLMKEIHTVQKRCFQYHQLTFYAIENLKLQIVAAYAKSQNQNLNR